MAKESIILVLPTKYTEVELKEFSEKVGDRYAELIEVENEFDKVKKEFKEEISGIESDIRESAMKIHNKSYQNDVECEATVIDGKVVEVVRKDTGEKVDDEGQLNMNLKTIQEIESNE